MEQHSTIQPLSQPTPSPAWPITAISDSLLGNERWLNRGGGLDRLQMGLCECWTGVGARSGGTCS